MTASERRSTIQSRLANRGEVSIGELTEEFAVSEMTIRRDLEELEDQGVARRIRGGAIATLSRSYEPPLAGRANEQLPAKRAIAQAAAELVDFGETVILDVGSTAVELARCLRSRGGLTVLTSSIRAATELADSASVRVILSGGIVRPGELSLIGDFAERTFEQLNCDVAFLGVGGIHPQKGLTEYNLDDARVKRAAIKAASRKVVLADHTKLDRVCLATVASFEEIDVLITDADPEHELLQVIREAGVQVICVTPRENE